MGEDRLAHAGLQRDQKSLGTSCLFPMHVISGFESGTLLREKIGVQICVLYLLFLPGCA